MSKQIRDIIPETGGILYIDIGNSSLKAAYREERQWKRPGTGPFKNPEDLVEWMSRHRHDFEMVVISSVVEKTTNALAEKLNNENVRILASRDIPPDLLDYETPETLGIDRFLACYGAISVTGNAAVVVDAGTACTVDYMTADGIYRGGVIMPGMGIMEQALKRYAPGLPGVSRSIPDSWPGRSTKASLQWGLAGTFRDSIRAMLYRYEQQLGGFDLVITGGYAQWLDTLLDRKAEVRPNLIFEGMQQFIENFSNRLFAVEN